MTRKSDVQYIRLYTEYTDGSAAKQVAPKAPKWKRPAPKFHQQKKRVVRVDPLALGGIVVAVVMFILMGVGVFQLHSARQEAAAMETYVQILEAENSQLSQAYAEKCDLAATEKTALALGMVSVDEVEQVTIHVELPHQEETPSTWENILAFLNGLFA